MEIVLKNKMTIAHLQKLIQLIYGTNDIIFINGNMNDLRRSNVLVK